MLKRSGITLVLVLGLSVTLILSGVAIAGPHKNVLENGIGYWVCSGEVAVRVDFEGGKYDDVDSNRGGNYRYNRKKGRVNIQTGFLQTLFGKFKRNSYGGWKLELRKKSNSQLRSVCGPSTYSY